VLGFFSSRRNWDYPTPHPQVSVPPPPILSFRGGTFACGRGGGGVPVPIFFQSGGSDPTKKEEEKNKFLLLFPVLEAGLHSNLLNILKYLKDLSELTKNLGIFNPKIVYKLSEIWVGSGIRKNISRSQWSNKHWSPDPQFSMVITQNKNKIYDKTF
jgi:hypothetical protein